MFSFTWILNCRQERLRNDTDWKQFLFITLGAQTVVRFEERNLSEKDKQQISDFYRVKALQGFKQEYPDLESGRDEL